MLHPSALRRVNPWQLAQPQGRSREIAVMGRRRCQGTSKPSDVKAEISRGPKPQPIIEYPEPRSETWDECSDFHEALSKHMDRHGDTVWHLYRALKLSNESFNRTTLREWRAGRKAPRSKASFEILARIERRYRLPTDYFRAKLPHRARATTRHIQCGALHPAERRRLAWHLPDDFDERSNTEQQQILAWVRQRILTGGTAYRRYQSRSTTHRFALRFPSLVQGRRLVFRDHQPSSPASEREVESDELRLAPSHLAREMEELVRYKSATLTTIGVLRSGVWNEESAQQRIEHLGLMFGALASPARSKAAGLGAPLSTLCFAILVFPAVWDWYLQWRERRRGFFTIWEANMLQFALSLTRRGTGWLRQRPDLSARLRPIPSLITHEDIDAAKADWDRTCDRLAAHAALRGKEIKRVARVHRDLRAHLTYPRGRRSRQRIPKNHRGDHRPIA